MRKASLLTALLPLLPLFSLADPAAPAAPVGVQPPSRLPGPAPVMPPEALRAGHQGRVMLAFQVDVDGHPQEIHVVRSSRSPLLDRAARQGVQRLRFRPARLASGEAVAAPVRLALEFLEWPEPGQRCHQFLSLLNWTRSTWADDPAEQWKLLGGHVLQLLPSDTPPASTENEALLQRAERVAAACVSTPARPAVEVWKETP
jgi:protein TonB